MKTEDIIKQAASLRDATKKIIEETEGETSAHLVNAAGAFHSAVTNLEGHVAAQKAAATDATETDSK